MVCPPRAAVLGSRTRVDAYNRSITKPLTGEPDAGDPPVRFGGRGKVQSLVPTPIHQARAGSNRANAGLRQPVVDRGRPARAPTRRDRTAGPPAGPGQPVWLVLWGLQVCL